MSANRGTQYTNPISTVGLQISVAAPVDDRLIVESESVLEELFIAPHTDEKILYRSVLHDSMLILIKDTKRVFIWVESSYGLMDLGYVYPSYMNDEEGQDYANKEYNFVLHTAVNKITKTYTNIADDFILIENKEIPAQASTDGKTGVQVLMRSSVDSFRDIHFPDGIESVSEGIKVFFDPKPNVNEIFRITIM